MSIRAIKKAKYNEHTNKFFLDLEILELSALYTWYISKFMFRYTHGSLDNIFTTHESIIMIPLEIDKIFLSQGINLQLEQFT